MLFVPIWKATSSSGIFLTASAFRWQFNKSTVKIQEKQMIRMPGVQGWRSLKTEIIKIDSSNIEMDKIAYAADVIRSGGLVAFPTETVYGLGANALDQEAVKKIFKAKGRPADNPLIVHISDKSEVNRLVTGMPPDAPRLMETFWPGPLTLVMKKSEIVPHIITAGLDSVAVRMPSHPVAMALIAESGTPVAAPSANTSGKPSPTMPEHVIEDMSGKVEIIIEAGSTNVGLESTVLDLTVVPPVILRPGGITPAQLLEVLKEVDVDPGLFSNNIKGIPPKSPGVKYRHYSPKADVMVVDYPDCVYKTEMGKFNAVINEIEDCYKRGQPVLIGTISIEKSEILSSMLKRRGVPHQVLNAKYHDKEAEIIAQAGKLGAVTIATNMAGRGTDIMLGGNPEFIAKQEMRKLGYSEELINQSTGFNEVNDEIVLEARREFRRLYEEFKKATNEERKKVIELGGLHIIGTERHESRRIDNQLRGRSGRQGDPGSSRFYISLEDDLMRLFGSDRLTGIVDALGLEEDQPIEHRMLSNAIESAQRRVEGKNFDIRKHVLQYDDVMNKQREVIYAQRKQVLNGENLKDSFIKMIESVVDSIINVYCSESPHPDFWDWEGMTSYFEDIFLNRGVLDEIRQNLEELTAEDLKEKILTEVLKAYEGKEQEFGSELMRELERVVLLRVVDEKWMDHIDAMDQLRYGIGLRAYGQRDPVVEYKFEGFEMFEEMVKNIQEDALRMLLRLKKEHIIQRQKVAEPASATHGDGAAKPVVRSSTKVGRNDPCPCGSGKKYKKCCGAN
jgi:tRNA threonylcarbamoyl adenosine modification protein (Sua5/YciO/YrdC/YwlC family)